MDVYASSSKVLNMDHVATVSVNNDLRVRVSNMMKSLDYVISAGLPVSRRFLAFIVLYNLTNINITERIREIATIKVLGFYQRNLGLRLQGEFLPDWHQRRRRAAPGQVAARLCHGTDQGGYAFL